MANPVPGKSYTVVAGDTLSTLAAKAYGDSEQWPRIWNANQQQIKSDDPEEVFPGEVLFIPESPLVERLKADLQKNKVSGKDKDAFTLLIEDREVPVLNGKVYNAMDVISGSWTATIAWTPGADPKLDKLLLPYQYPKTKVYLGDTLVSTGSIYNPESKLIDSDRIRMLTGYSKTVDAVDSTIKPPYQAEKVTLQQRVESLLKNFGISVEYELENDGQFDRVTADSLAKIFDHVKKIVAQRGALITDTPQGNVKIYKASSEGVSVGTLEEGQPGVTEWAGSWDGRKRFSVYKAIAQTALSGASGAIAKDNSIPKSRFMTFKANDTIKGNVQDAANWRRSKSIGDSLAQRLPVDSWYAPNGDLWQENTFVTVISETLHIAKGYKYLIRSVDYDFSATGTPAVLNLVPYQVFTGEEVIAPWDS